MAKNSQCVIVHHHADRERLAQRTLACCRQAGCCLRSLCAHISPSFYYCCARLVKNPSETELMFTDATEHHVHTMIGIICLPVVMFAGSHKLKYGLKGKNVAAICLITIFTWVDWMQQDATMAKHQPEKRRKGKYYAVRSFEVFPHLKHSTLYVESIVIFRHSDKHHHCQGLGD